MYHKYGRQGENWENVIESMWRTGTRCPTSPHMCPTSLCICPTSPHILGGVSVDNVVYDIPRLQDRYMYIRTWIKHYSKKYWGRMPTVKWYPSSPRPPLIGQNICYSFFLHTRYKGTSALQVMLHDTM